LERITSVNRLNTSFSTACSWVGSIFSDKVVNPRMSQNITVSSLLRAVML
jgi:hypothetical protein